MATLEQLCDRGDLVKIMVSLPRGYQPDRTICAYPVVITWITTELPTPPHLGEAVRRPLETCSDRRTAALRQPSLTVLAQDSGKQRAEQSTPTHRRAVIGKLAVPAGLA